MGHHNFLAASPYDEIATLDRVALERAKGDVDTAEERMLNGITNRSDDDYGPIQLPPRTAKVVEDKRPLPPAVRHRTG